MATINEFYIDIAFNPGDTLVEKLEELKMEPKEFAVRIGKPEQTIMAIINGESSITPETAVLFESVLKIPAIFWLRKQYLFDEYKKK
jgi:HTH-type transcriptional regulator / antitoxin HigA